MDIRLAAAIGLNVFACGVDAGGPSDDCARTLDRRVSSPKINCSSYLCSLIDTLVPSGHVWGSSQGNVLVLLFYQYNPHLQPHA